MHIHILGICGTFMGSLAQLAKDLGHQVSGCDSNVYPPMSTQLEKAGISLIEGFNPEQLHPAPDLIVVGNAMSRGNPCVEAMLDNQLPYISGPQWLGENILRNKHVLSVSGTHGKTTTSSMLVKILDCAERLAAQWGKERQLLQDNSSALESRSLKNGKQSWCLSIQITFRCVSV